jgi:NCS2 family nucleobase:cation symporter-2
MYAGAIAVPLIVGGAYHLPKDRLTLLVDADLFACGLATVIQSLGIGPFGIRFPVVMGASFVCVAPILVAASRPGAAIEAVFGAVVAAGIFGIVVAPFAARLVAFAPPVVTGSVITVIGLSLLGVAAGWAGGGVGAPDFAAPAHLALAFGVLVAIVLVIAFARGFARSVAVLLGLVLGLVVAALLGQVSLAGIGDEPWIAIVRPFAYGMPRFDPPLVVAMCIVMLVTMIESTGMFTALATYAREPLPPQRLRRGLLADGLGTLLGGVFNAFAYTSYSQNVGMVALTGVVDRRVTAVAGIGLIVLGLVPKLGYLVASIPQSVLGGAGFVMFGMVAATGIALLGRTSTRPRSDGVVVALAVGLGLTPMIAPGLTAKLPASVAPFAQDGIVVAAIAAVTLNALFTRFAPDEDGA